MPWSLAPRSIPCGGWIDVIEYPIVDDFDYSGWDLRKIMFLILKRCLIVCEKTLEHFKKILKNLSA
jgi:predicted nucleotidyltransferase